MRELWYFAYGSNLDPGTFLGRRRMRPLGRRVARLDGFELVFDLAVGRGERGVANVRPHPDAHLWGVAYQLTAPEFDRLDRTEGVHRGVYYRTAVSLRGADGVPLEAFTYQSDRRRPDRKPSRRYLRLLLVGARHHGLPTEYVRWLRELPLAEDERRTQLELFRVESRR